MLLTEGAQSPRLFHRLNDRLAELLPSVSRAAIPRASHIVHEDNPLDWTATVLQFLDRAG